MRMSVLVAAVMAAAVLGGVVGGGLVRLADRELVHQNQALVDENSDLAGRLHSQAGDIVTITQTVNDLVKQDRAFHERTVQLRTMIERCACATP